MATVSAPFTLTIKGLKPLVFTQAPTLPDAEQGVFYEHVFSADGGVKPYKWETHDRLPDGLTLDSASGKLSGTPLTSGKVPLQVQVTDSGV